MIQKVFIENFKAIHIGTELPFQPFTVFIGNNGTGKSSIVEALRVLQIAVRFDLNEAFYEFGGIEKARNKNADISENMEGKFGIAKDIFQPIKITIAAKVNENIYDYEVSINYDRVYVVENEVLKCNGKFLFTSQIKQNTENEAEVWLYDLKTQEKRPFFYKHEPNSLMLSYKGSPSYIIGIEEFSNYVENWQFLYLNAHIMGQPVAQNKLYFKKSLNYDGRNVAEFLLWLKDQGKGHWESLIQKMQFVLPYIKDIEPHVLTETINTEIELLLHESKGKQKAIPGWLLSSGTLRILALLAMFETPGKPSVLFVDEIENGLDPRTIGLLLNQIENVFSDKTMQVIVTTHSPYFLDMVPFDSIIVSEKLDDGSTYHIPKDEKGLNEWKEKFTPGKLYTLGKLTK
jgi:predicted ATPase